MKVTQAVMRQVPSDIELEVPDSENARHALRLAVAVLYFADSSDFRGALWDIVRALSPDVAKLLEDDERAAYEVVETW